MEQKTEGVLEGKEQVSNTSIEDKTRQKHPHDENTLVSSGPSPKGVKYRVEYRNKFTSKIVHSVDTGGLLLELNDTGEIFDIVTTFFTDDEEFKPSEESKEHTRKQPRVTDTRKKIAVHIHSPAIIHALRSVVKYYPSQTLTSETIVIPEPFSILVHHEEELKEYRERCHPGKQTDPVCPMEKNAYHDIKILQDFLEQFIMPAVRLERERNARGLETFDMLWLRMKPGTTTKSQDAGSSYWYGRVIESVRGGGGGAQAWTVGYWTLDYNGSYLGTCKSSVDTERFEGEREIKGTYTVVFEDSDFEEPVAESVKALVEQGQKFYQLLTKSCQYYKGTTYNFPHNQVSPDVLYSPAVFSLICISIHIRLLLQLQVDGLVMVDMKEFHSQSDYDKPSVSFIAPEKPWVTDCSCFVCRRRKEEQKFKNEEKSDVFEDYHGIYPEDRKSLTPHQLFLLPTKIGAFLFKTRTWGAYRRHNEFEITDNSGRATSCHKFRQSRIQARPDRQAGNGSDPYPNSESTSWQLYSRKQARCQIDAGAVERGFHSRQRPRSDYSSPWPAWSWEDMYSRQVQV